MKISVLTLFPDMFGALSYSMIGRAQASGIVAIDAVDIRAYTADKHGKCDDIPYGGGAGMVMTPQPIVDCVRAVDPDKRARRIYMSPRGRRLTTGVAQELAREKELLFLCGHYEGVDERALDALLRFVPGVLGCGESAMTESFSDGMLEYPQYTRPAIFEGLAVPEVLLSGHHTNIEKWRRAKSEEITRAARPDLLKDDN